MRAATVLLLLLLVAWPALASESVLSHGRKKDDTLLGYLVWIGGSNQTVFYNNGKTHQDDDCLMLWASSSSSDTVTAKGNCKTDEEASMTFPRDVVVTQFSVFNSLVMQYGTAFQSCVVRLQKYDPSADSYTALASYTRRSTSGSSDTTVGETDSQSLNALIPAGHMLQFSSVDGPDNDCPVPGSGTLCICFGSFQSVLSVYGYTK